MVRLETQPQRQTKLPPRVAQARRFLAARGLVAGGAARIGASTPVGTASFTQARRVAPGKVRLAAGRVAATLSTTAVQNSSTATWQPLGPTAVLTPQFGLVTGRISSLALDPADNSGNHLYVGTTGGGVWQAQNAGSSTTSSIVFTPLTDGLAALGGAPGASISIGAVSVQPGGTGVILAGTGDPNDALDSYYGAGILRSTDGGTTWTLIQQTTDRETGLSLQDYSFIGEGFAGFAWSNTNPQLVVAAVSQAYEGALVNAGLSGFSYEGLYYSTDAGATWHLATIRDTNGSDVQGPGDTFAQPDGNAATAVVWNPVRQMFVAAVRYHGYYGSADGVTWTRLTAQPGTGLTQSMCPTNPSSVGSIACPIFRGALAVNPQTGDTFAWTVDIDNQDQGLWQDQCAISNGACGNPAITFGKQWSTAALEADTAGGAATIPNGDYDLVLAAVPLQQDTVLLAGANDLWKCSLAMGCVWRNTTNSTTCMSAQVGEFQHALAWNASNPQEIFIGNDSGLWRSTDGIGETDAQCSSSDAGHFQNLNGGLGSLAEPESISQVGQSPYTMMAGLGVNGTAGVKGTSGPTADWPQILSGEGGPVAIDPVDPTNWYVNNQPGVSIHVCSQSGDCTPADFGASAAVNNADVGGDGNTMTAPAPFLVDPLDHTQLLIGTCRVWRGPANGTGWTASNAVGPVLGSGSFTAGCSGDALIRSLVAMALPDGTEVVYAGMYGALDGGANIPGHVFRAVIDPASSSTPVWQDLTFSPVTNSQMGFNYYGQDISSIFIDPHDTTGNTVYVTVEGMPRVTANTQVLYRSTDGGLHWSDLASNLPQAPANSVVVDPQDANTVYVATDTGVYFTTQAGTCAQTGSSCWSAFGTGLPESPVVALSAAPASASQQVLVAATYGRGIWQTPLSSAGTGLTTASASPASLTFSDQAVGTASAAQTVTLSNTGTAALVVTAITVSSNFTEIDNCQAAPLSPAGSCAIQVAFAPGQSGSLTGQVVVSANVANSQLTIGLSGTGVAAGEVTLTPATINFATVQVGSTSAQFPVTVANNGTTAVAISSINVSAQFLIASNSCGTSSLAAQSDCQLEIEFSPTQAGTVTGTLALNDAAGTQTVALAGTGGSPATDVLSPTSLTFPNTVTGQISAAQTVQLTNSGDVALTSIAASISSGFSIVSNNCTTQLPAHSSCAIQVAFAPSQTGPQSGTLTVSDALRTQTVSLSGTALAPPVLTVSPSSLSFAQQQPGTVSAPQTITIGNAGGAPMANVGFQITGAAASSFAVSASTCGSVLNNGASCTAQVTFSPMATGGLAATLTVSSSTIGVKPASVTLTGTAQSTGGLIVSPTELDFPAVTPGQTSPSQTVNITNTASLSATSLTVSVSPPFVLTQSSCGVQLAAGASCTAAVAYAPTSGAGGVGTLTVTSPAIAGAASVALIGSAGMQVTPASINFPTTGAGTVSNPVTVTVTNLSATSTLNNVAFNLPAGFKLVANTCGVSLAPQASCTAGVEFAPTSAGATTGTLTVTASTLQAPPVALSGMGFDFTAAIIGASSQTVSSGQTANYAIVLTTLNGSQGDFTFSCSSLPTHALCIFSPSTEPVGSGAQGNVKVEISTGQTIAAVRAPASPWPAVPLVCSIFLLPLIRKRRAAWLVMMLLGVFICLGTSACTSSGGGTGGAPTGQSGGGGTTPAGTYSIQLTATSTGIQHAVTVTMTVD